MGHSEIGAHGSARRIGAASIDLAIAAPPGALVAIAVCAAAERFPMQVVAALVALGIATTFVLQRALSDAGTRTPGRWLTGTRLVRTGGGAPGVGAALLRALFAPVAFFRESLFGTRVASAERIDLFEKAGGAVRTAKARIAAAVLSLAALLALASPLGARLHLGFDTAAWERLHAADHAFGCCAPGAGIPLHWDACAGPLAGVSEVKAHGHGVPPGGVFAALADSCPAETLFEVTGPVRRDAIPAAVADAAASSDPARRDLGRSLLLPVFESSAGLPGHGEVLARMFADADPAVVARASDALALEPGADRTAAFASHRQEILAALAVSTVEARPSLLRGLAAGGASPEVLDRLRAASASTDEDSRIAAAEGLLSFDPADAGATQTLAESILSGGREEAALGAAMRLGAPPSLRSALAAAAEAHDARAARAQYALSRLPGGG